MVAARKLLLDLGSTVFLPSRSLAVATYLPVLAVPAIPAIALDAVAVFTQLSSLGLLESVASFLTSVLSYTFVLFHALSLSFNRRQFY